MGYIRRPAYYKAFRCIGSDCTENCCIGWEIDVDEDSLACYETVPGDFGERLRASIAPADAQTGEPAHFRLDAEERCPLLNDCNLCEVLLTLGEDKMAQICTDHPRYYEWFSDGREDGLGLCCEAAAELILAQTGAPAFDVTEADGVSETGTEAETELENVLFSMRDRSSICCTRRARRRVSEATVSKCSSSVGYTPSCMASTVASMAISGVRSSCATSEVRRFSCFISFSSEVAISSKVSPS